MRRLLQSCAILLFSTLLWGQSTLPAFPPPEKTVKDKKQFKALHFEGTNTISIRQTPPDFELEAFDFSANENLLYLEWGSGRLETRDLESGKKVTELKPVKGPIWEVLQGQVNQLAVVTQHGVIRFIDPHSGKTLRLIRVEPGKFNYDIQQILLAPNGSWLAYVNEDNGKVLDLNTDPPKVLADLGDGYDMALSPDGRALWVVDRRKIFGLDVDNWKPISSSNLLDQVAADQSPTLAVLTDHNSLVAFIPSKSGLLRYDLPSLTGRRVSSVPTYWVGADREHNRLFVHEFKVSALYATDGNELCRWQIHPAQDFKMSPSGRWLGDRLFGSVELWSTQSLINDCAALGRTVSAIPPSSSN